MERKELGRQPRSKVLRAALARLIEKREPAELIVVHHYTDTSASIQLEYERRSEILGIQFGRLLLKNE